VNEDPLAAFRLDGRVAIVTGASSGIGARLVRALYAARATVVAAARRADRLEELAGTLDTFRPVLAVNLTAAFVLSRLASRHMLEQGRGSIVNGASILGLVGVGQCPGPAMPPARPGW
jgi:NAD(P)-dependent dehydrogenase (short-subunit alcohol dehydrogenase family)